MMAQFSRQQQDSRDDKPVRERRRKRVSFRIVTGFAIIGISLAMFLPLLSVTVVRAGDIPFSSDPNCQSATSIVSSISDDYKAAGGDPNTVYLCDQSQFQYVTPAQSATSDVTGGVLCGTTAYDPFADNPSMRPAGGGIVVFVCAHQQTSSGGSSSGSAPSVTTDPNCNGLSGSSYDKCAAMKAVCQGQFPSDTEAMFECQHMSGSAAGTANASTGACAQFNGSNASSKSDQAGCSFAMTYMACSNLPSATTKLVNGSPTDMESPMDACMAGYSNKDTAASYCADTFKVDPLTQACATGASIDPTAIKNAELCSESGGTWDDGTNSCTPKGGTTDGTDNTCQQNGGLLAWIMCPILTAISTAFQDLFQSVLNLLFQYNDITATPDCTLKDSSGNVVNDSSGNPEKDPNCSGASILSVWQKVVPIGNIIFAMVFLLIIYSTATGNGFGALSNYDIKKILPRLILSAVALNVSFYICAALVDLSNIIGANIGSFLAGVNGQPVLGVADIAFTSMAIIIACIVMFPTILLAVLLILVVAVARNVILTVLIVVSPVAFALWMLPNTENVFKKWWQEFTRMLFVYPMISAVFGACMLVDSVLKTDGGSKIVSTILTVVLVLVPAVAVIPIMKMGGAAMGAITGAVRNGIDKAGGNKFREYGQNVNKRLRDNVAGKTKQLSADQIKKLEANPNSSRFAKGLANRVNGLLTHNERSKAIQEGRQRQYANEANERLANMAGTRGQNGQMVVKDKKLAEAMGAGNENVGLAVASQNLNKQFEEEVAAHTAMFDQDNLSSGQILALATNAATPEAQRTAAVRSMLASGKLSERQAVYDSIDGTTSEHVKQAASKGYFAKGDQKYFGAGFGGDIQQGVHIDANTGAVTRKMSTYDAIVDNANNGKIEGSNLSDAEYADQLAWAHQHNALTARGQRAAANAAQSAMDDPNLAATIKPVLGGAYGAATNQSQTDIVSSFMQHSDKAKQAVAAQTAAAAQAAADAQAAAQAAAAQAAANPNQHIPILEGIATAGGVQPLNVAHQTTVNDAYANGASIEEIARATGLKNQQVMDMITAQNGAPKHKKDWRFK